MNNKTIRVRLTEHARFALNSLGDDDSRRVTSWLDHLPNWHNDELLRSNFKRLNSSEELYLLSTDDDFLIVISLTADEIVVLSIFHRDTLRDFGSRKERMAVRRSGVS